MLRTEPTGASVSPLTDLDRAAGARRSELHDAERVVWRIVDVEREADLILIERRARSTSLTGSVITSTENVGILRVMSPLRLLIPIRSHKSMTTSRTGCEQQTRTLPSAGFSSGAGA